MVRQVVDPLPIYTNRWDASDVANLRLAVPAGSAIRWAGAANVSSGTERRLPAGLGACAIR